MNIRPIFAAAALLSASTAFAQDSQSVSFRFDRALSVEQNYQAFTLTAKRACEAMSSLTRYSAQQACRSNLVAQAVSATRHGNLIAHHQSHTSLAREVAVLDR